MKKTIDKITDWLSWFLGSWLAIVLHTTWFTVWLIFNYSLDALTLSVSLEAIFIGIFLLMASNRAEAQRDRLQAKIQAKMITELEEDVEIDTKQSKYLKDLIDKVDILQKQVNKLSKKI